MTKEILIGPHLWFLQRWELSLEKSSSNGKVTLITIRELKILSKERRKSGMIERAIENWLINANEKNYQIAYCQVLSQKGRRVIYVSSHRPMDRGKDIVTINSRSEYCAY